MPPAQFALAGLCGALSLVLAYEVAAPIPPFDVPKSADVFRPAPITFQDSASAPSAASFDDIDAHPVFSASRAPIASHGTTTHGGTSSAFPTDVSLIGVIIEGKTRLALVKTASEPFAQSVPEGGAIEGWTVSEIDPDKIVLASGVTKQEILLAANRGSDAQGLSVNSGIGPGAGLAPMVPPPNLAPAPSTVPQPLTGAGTTHSPAAPAPPNTPSVSPKPPPDNPSAAPHQ